MKKVLIVVYYWPPSGGSGVQRWLKFAKYLSKTKWEPIIYTPENPDFSIQDESLLEEIPADIKVLKRKIWEPYSVARKLFGKKHTVSSSGIVDQSSFGQKLLNFIRGNLFVPDPRVFWRKPSVKFLESYIRDNQIDALITSGTPHSMHLIGLDLKKKLDIPWIADFRDPWSELDMLQDYHILPWIMKRYQKLEQKVIQSADACTITSKVWTKDLNRLGAKKAITLTNGFDEENFQSIVEPYDNFVLSHFGLMNHLRNPSNLWKALADLCKEDAEFDQKLKLHLGGTIESRILKEIKSHPELENKLEAFPYISHNEVLEEYKKSSVLLLLLFNSESGKGNIPGKLFEYLASKKPILAFGPQKGDSAELVEQTPHSSFNHYDSASVKQIKDQILEVFRKRNVIDSNIFQNSDQYSHRELSKKLSQILDDISVD